MKNSRWLRTLAASPLLAAAALTGCIDGGTAGPEEPDLAGTYVLLSITLPDQAELSPPLATGTLTLFHTSYEVNVVINLPEPASQTIQDNGTYTIKNNRWTQESELTGFQGQGTYLVSGSRLELTVTTQGETVTSAWTKNN